MSTERRTFTAAIEVERPELEARAAGDERIPIAISSEFPVERTDWTTGEHYLEVLDHTPAAIDLTRAARGLPLLLSHEQRDQYGVVENVRLGNDGRLRGEARFSRGVKAQEIRQDLLDGIRTSMSVGYTVGDQYVLETSDKGLPIRRMMKWQPLEVSTVPVPADPTVGVNRAAPSRVTTLPSARITHMENEQPEVEQTREQAFFSIANAAGLSINETYDAMAKYRTADAFGRACLERMADATQLSPPSPSSPSNYGARTSTGFFSDFTEAVLAPESAAAKAKTRSLSKELGISARGSLVPLVSRAMTMTGVGSGKEFSPVLQRDVVDLMRPRMVSTEFGARIESYAGGSISRPTITSDAAYAWLAENGSGIAASDLGTSAITMIPRAISTRTTHTAQSLRTSQPEIASQILEAHASRLAVGVDAAVLAGLGSANQPTGVLYNAGSNVVAMGTNGAVVTYGKLCELEQAIDLASAPMEGLGFVTTPQIRSRMRQTQDFPSAAAGRPLWNSDNTVLGHRAMTTTSMPANLTKGTSSGTCHSAILGDFTQIVIGYWAGLDVIVDPYTDAAKGLTHITTTMYVDVGVLQPTAFAVIRDLTLA